MRPIQTNVSSTWSIRLLGKNIYRLVTRHQRFTIYYYFFYSVMQTSMMQTAWTYILSTVQEQELLTLPEHLRSPLVFSGVRVTPSLFLYACFVDRCLSFCTFSFGHCVVCSSSIYGFWLPLWYLQTLLLLYTVQ